MVVLHMKRGGDDSGVNDAFLYETSCASKVDALIADLVSRRDQNVCGMRRDLL